MKGFIVVKKLYDVQYTTSQKSWTWQVPSIQVHATFQSSAWIEYYYFEKQVFFIIGWWFGVGRELAVVHKRLGSMLNLELSCFLFSHTRTQHTQPVKCKYSPKSRSNLTGMKLYAMSSVKTLLKNLSGHPVTRKVKPMVLLKGCFYELIVSNGRCRVHSWLSDYWQRFSASFSQVTREWWYHSRIYQFCKSMNTCVYADLLMLRLV